MRRLLVFFAIAIALASSSLAGEIFCKHFLHGQPVSTVPSDNDLVIRDCYALSNNAKTKFADWVAFRLTPQEVFGTLDLLRKWRNDDWLDADKTLKATPSDTDAYKGAHELGYDRGHLAPLASFRGSRDASQVDFYSNIVPQKSDLNQGAWERLERSVRSLTLRYQYVWVVTGPLYEKPMKPLPNAPQATVPSGFWQIVMIQPKRKDVASLRVAAFIFDQDTPRVDKIIDHVAAVREIEKRAKLNFLHRLPPDREEHVETAVNRKWVEDDFEAKADAAPPPAR